MSGEPEVLVLGLGRSGRAAIELLRGLGARVTAYDADPARGEQLPEGVRFESGSTPPDYARFERVVASPGLRLDPHPLLVPEVELAWEQLRAPLVGVTGTNGKSTTTLLIGELLSAAGRRVAVGGNLGTALCELVAEPADWFVAELSSFQLEHARRLHARVAVLLNLSPDHLDRHASLQAYGAAKARLAELQRPGDVLVANLDDAWARGVAERSPARVLGISERAPVRSGAFVEGKDLVVTLDGAEYARVACDAIAPAARSPLVNALAAAAAATACGAAAGAIASGLERFEGLPHRGSCVCTRRGVRYLDDSKATNPTAAVMRLRAQPGAVVWIAGGRNKGLDFAPLREAVGGVRVALLYGESASELEHALAGAVACERFERLEEAVARAAVIAEPADVVLLAPACTSFDQFPSYEARGARFAELARALPDSAAGEA